MGTSLHIHVLAFTHKNVFLNDLGKLVLSKEEVTQRLDNIRSDFRLGVYEIFYVSTCNRVEFVFATEQPYTKANAGKLLAAFFSGFSELQIKSLLEFANLYQGDEAVEHLLMVASSLDSMVVGEREISRQLRQAYEESAEAGLTGDHLRILMKQTIKTAKEVFTHTRIAEKPVSVASLAVRKLLDLGVSKNERVVLVGAGETNTLIAKYLVKAGFTKFTVFNRTYQKAKALADELNGDALPFDSLQRNCSLDFGVLISCTGSTEAVVTASAWEALTFGQPEKYRFIVDLAIPNDIDELVSNHALVHCFSISDLKAEVEANLKFREKEVIEAHKVVKRGLAAYQEMNRIRQVERALQDFPDRVKAIKQKTVQDVFSKEMALLDDNTRSLIDKMLSYMEKKCISVPIVIAKDILLKEEVEVVE